MLKNSASTNIVSFTNVTKTYRDGEVALHGATLSVAQGEFLCIIGPSGCGKSTILKIIAGLEEATEGSVVRPQEVSMVFQGGALFPWLTALENVSLGLHATGMSKQKIERESFDYLAMLGLAEFAHKYPRELSGGQRQRIGIARALAVKPSVLLLDEPFSALDPKTTHFLHEDLIRLWKETGVTIVMVSHLIEEAVTLGQRVVLMQSGSIADTFLIDIPYPRHEQGTLVLTDVQRIRRAFFKTDVVE